MSRAVNLTSTAPREGRVRIPSRNGGRRHGCRQATPGRPFERREPAPTGPFDVLITGARIVDGAGNPWVRGDVGLREDLDPSQSITREEALEAVTRGYAHLTFEKGEKGTLEVGMAADLVVTVGHVLECEDPCLESMQVDLTVVGGRVVYERRRLASTSMSPLISWSPTCWNSQGRSASGSTTTAAMGSANRRPSNPSPAPRSPWPG